MLGRSTNFAGESRYGIGDDRIARVKPGARPGCPRSGGFALQCRQTVSSALCSTCYLDQCLSN